MRLVSYVSDQGEDWGVLRPDGGVVGHDRLEPGLPDTLVGLIESWAPEREAELAQRVNGQSATPIGALKLLPVVPHPRKIICLGVNYVDHAKEGGNTVADYPTLFLRSATSMLAHGEPLRVPRVSSKLDFEAELALVIGARARDVAEQDALQHVFGYACFNDATLRDYQKRTSQWTIGKNFDGTGGFGPCLVTASELPPGCVGLHIESRLNGRVMQSASTSDMVFGVAQTIALLSECLTLEAGDVVLMGTPAGVGYARNPPVWMQAGDLIEIDIEGIGVLSNPVVA